jgi:hypothetical protein
VVDFLLKVLGVAERLVIEAKGSAALLREARRDEGEEDGDGGEGRTIVSNFLSKRGALPVT